MLQIRGLTGSVSMITFLGTILVVLKLRGYLKEKEDRYGSAN